MKTWIGKTWIGMTWIGAAIVTAALAVGDPAGTALAAATSKPTILTAPPSGVTDFGARRYHRRYAYRAYDRPQPQYYDRPYYYRPYPYSVPAPFTFGFAFGPRW
jgi:hypothetical protein